MKKKCLPSKKSCAEKEKAGLGSHQVGFSTNDISIFFNLAKGGYGYETGKKLRHQLFPAYFENVFIHKFDSATTVGLLLTLVLIFMGQSEVILENPLHIVLIAVPLILQTFLIFLIAYGTCKLLKLPHEIAAPAGMIGASNFFELAVAVAVALFGATSPAALATTVGVLTEVPVMLTLVKIANQTKKYFH